MQYKYELFKPIRRILNCRGSLVQNEQYLHGWVISLQLNYLNFNKKH